MMRFVSGEEATSVVDGFTFTGAQGDSYESGGMYLYGSSPTLTHIILTGNTGGYFGGGMELWYASPSLSHVILTGNTADYHGGGMFLYTSSPSLSHVILTGNTAKYSGGGMAMWYTSSPSLSHVILTGNRADYSGGGMSMYDSSPSLDNAIIAYNTGGYNVDISGGAPTFNHCALYAPDGNIITGASLDGTNLTVEPGFLDDPIYDDTSGMWIIPDLHLAIDSPLVDAGDPDSEPDADGSSADIGSYGGPNGGAWDLDDDGYPDYFWPGTLDDAPQGFDASDYDADDTDGDIH